MDISKPERTEYPLRLIWRILVVLFLVFLFRNAFIAESPEAYISKYANNSWVQQIEWEISRVQRAAQDLPASLEVVIRRLIRNVKPVEAKPV